MKDSIDALLDQWIALRNDHAASSSVFEKKFCKEEMKRVECEITDLRKKVLTSIAQSYKIQIPDNNAN